MKSFCRNAGILAAMLAACAAASADEPQKKEAVAGESTALPTVTVGALREPVDKSYRKILKGMELFEKMHGLAPNATLRFKLLPRHRDTDMQGVELEIVGNTVNIPVKVAADHTFALERNQKALQEDASVMPNRKAGSMTWRAEIRTPGLPPDTRRLGDLRLECRVGMEADLVSNARSTSIFDELALLLDKRPGYCERKEARYYFFAERPLFGVTLVTGDRRETLSVDQLYAGATREPVIKPDLAYCDCEVLLAQTYFVPLGDHSWPDDTLIEFEYMDDGRQRAAAPSTAAKDERR